MKVSILSFLLIAFSFSIFGQSIEINDKSVISKNKIKSKTLYEYEYVNGKPENKGIKARVDSFDVYGNKTAQINFKEGSVQLTITSKYDIAGNRTQYAQSRPKYNFVQNTKYDSKSQKILEFGFNGVDTFKNVFNYNKNGKLAEVNYFLKRKMDEKRTFAYGEGTVDIKVLGGDGKLKYTLKYTLTPTGKNKEETQIETDNSVSRQIVYGYDKNDNLTSELKYLNGKIVQKITYIYNEGNQLIESWQENQDGTKFLSHKYLYNSKGLLTEEQWKTDSNKDFSKSTFIYDDFGVLKTMDSYYANFKKQLLSVYVYEYY